MRISTTMAARRALENIESTNKKLDLAMRQVSTGKRIFRGSDDPAASGVIAKLSAERKDLDRYNRNITSAREILTDSENALSGINEAMQKIRELAAYAQNSSLSLADRQDIALEIGHNKEMIISGLNTSAAGSYIFGGFNSQVSPLIDNAGEYLYNGADISTLTAAERDAFLSENLSVAVGHGIKLTFKLSAIELTGTGEHNLLSTIDNFITEITADTPDKTKVDAFFSDIASHHDNILLNMTKVGSFIERLSLVEGRLENRGFAIDSKISDKRDIDIEEAIMKYRLAEQAYNASLSISAKTIQTSLLDYIK